METKSLIIQPGELDRDALADYARVLDHDTSGGLAGLEERFHGAQLFDVIDGEVVALRFALRVDHHANGSEGRIVAAAGELRGVDLTHAVLPTIESMFQGCRAIACMTARRGLVLKMAKHGYRTEAYLLRKRLEH